MTAWMAAYAISLVAFGILDMTWLSFVGAKLYKPVLGDILEPGIRLAPASAFYLMFPAGLIYFAVNPALKDGALGTALLNGALFGLFTYGTYELTNFATLRNWTLQITLIDMAYGAVMCAAVAALAFKLTPAVARWFGA